MTFSLFDKTRIPILSKALDAYSLRNKAIASNIANVGTEGYRAQRVRFEEELSGALNARPIPLEQTSGQHIGGMEPGLPTARLEDVSSPEDGRDQLASGVNDVDIDREMAELAKNQIQFKYAARLLSESFKGLQKSIRGQA